MKRIPAATAAGIFLFKVFHRDTFDCVPTKFFLFDYNEQKGEGAFLRLLFTDVI